MIMVVTDNYTRSDIQGDDDLILHSALNRGTSTVSQFFIIILGRWPNSKSHSGKTSRPQNTKISHASKFPFYPCGDGSKVGWWGGLPVIFLITTSLAPETLRKKFISLSLCSETTHRNFPSPSLSPPPPPYRIIATAFIRRPSRRTSKPHPPAPALSSTTPDNHNLQTLHSSTTPPEPLELRCRPPHRSRFADAVVVRTGSSSPTAVCTAPQPLHRRRRP